MAFPPIPIYPEEIDNDYTLFLTHNSVEARISADNPPWSQEINVFPVEENEQEIWSNNGFANISGELLYYDSVDKDSNGKVIVLKGCARNLGGDKTKFNKKGTTIRSFVVAEHHNQLVDAILNVENFVGHNFDERQETLDWRIRNLAELESIFDDFSCPDIDFTWNIVENDPVRGVTAEYLIEATPPGFISSFRLDFGDGEFTTTELEGSHQYSLNARIDPVITITNDKCQIIQTPIERTNPSEPQPQIEEGLEIPIPEIPDIPDFTLVPFDVPQPDINLPPLSFPCMSLSGDSVPSIIQGPDIHMVSNVTITGPEEPVQILHSTVEIIGDVNIPPVIVIDGPPIPPTIVVDPPIPPTIVIVPPQSEITLNLEATDLPKLEVDWGAPPEMEVAMTFAQQVKKPQKFGADPELVEEFGEEFADLFEASNSMKVEYESVGIPSEIKIIPPDKDSLKVDMPESVKIDATEVDIPENIHIHGPDNPIPDSIRLDGNELPEAIELIYEGDPIPVKVETEVTVSIEQLDKLPEKIFVEVPESLPDIKIDASAIPNSIALDAPRAIQLEIPEGIPLLLPEEMPEVELVYKGSPIELKVTLDEVMDKNAQGNNCVMITPCLKS